MTSNRKKSSAIRKRKCSANKPNLKADMKRTQKTREILRELAAKEQA